MHRYLFQVAMWVGCVALVLMTSQVFCQDSIGDDDLFEVPPAPSPPEEDLEDRLPNGNPSKPGLKTDAITQMQGMAKGAPIGFESLFNGHNLDGWFISFEGLHRADALKEGSYIEAKQEAAKHIGSFWKVVDGQIQNIKMGGNLVSDQSFGNFEMYLDWKLTGKGNSGIFLRSIPQVQIWSDPIGSGGLSNNRDMFRKPTMNRDLPPGQWNRFHIRMFGNVVTVVNNGGIVINQGTLENYWNHSARIADRGPIELQNSEGHIAFRNIFVRSISDEQTQDREIKLSGGQVVKIAQGGFSLNTVYIPMKYAKNGKIILKNVYNEPLAAFIGAKAGQSLTDEGHSEVVKTILDVVSHENDIIITIPESLQARDELMVHLQILGTLAQLPLEPAEKQIAIPSTEELN